jgi:multidrug efflux pump subunit AcrA (membrane-fusion protein)
MGVAEISIKKWSKKKKIVSVVSLVLVCAIATVSLYALLKPDEGPEVTVSTVSLNNVIQTLDTTGTVESANQASFSILEGVDVLSVNVRVGDRVKAGDVLATFDTASVSSVLKEKQEAYNEAHAAYVNYIRSSKESEGQLVSINTQISELEQKVAELESKSDSSSEAVSVSKKEKSALSNLLSSILGETYSDSMIGKIIDNLLNAGNSVSQLTKVLTSLQDSGSMFAITQLMSGLSGSDSELSSAELQLIELKAKQALLSVESSSVLESTYKTINDSAFKSLQAVKSTVQLLNKGWIAQNDGIVREVNITAGEPYYKSKNTSSELDITSLLSAVTSGADVTELFSGTQQSGMVIEYYPFCAEFILGKYDVGKVSLDQSVKIKTTAGTELNGVITYISAVAESSNSINISSLLGTSGSSNGVPAKVSILNPDKNVIIGFDVDISIEVDRAENVPVIPIEALQTYSDGLYVFIYN